MLLLFSISFFREHFVEPTSEGKTFQNAALDISIYLNAYFYYRPEDLES